MRILLPRWLCRPWIALWQTPVIDVLSPPDDLSIARAKAQQRYDRSVNNVDEDGHVRLIRGLGEIQKATADNLLEFQRRKELDAIVSYRRTH